jgi:hypothetical protein
VGARWIAPRAVSGMAIAMLAVASCASHPASGGGGAPAHSAPAPTNSAYLRAHLLTDATLPAGLRLLTGAVMDDDPSAAGPSAAASDSPVSCSDLVTALSFVMAVTAPAAGAHVGIVGTTADHRRWSGGERLSSFAGDGATRVFAKVRSLVGRCPSRSDAGASPGALLADPSQAATINSMGPLTTNFSVVPGPALGNESIELRARTPSQVPGIDIEADAILIRSGSVLLTVNEGPMAPTPNGPSRLHELTSAAFARFQEK